MTVILLLKSKQLRLWHDDDQQNNLSFLQIDIHLSRPGKSLPFQQVSNIMAEQMSFFDQPRLIQESLELRPDYSGTHYIIMKTLLLCFNCIHLSPIQFSLVKELPHAYGREVCSNKLIYLPIKKYFVKFLLQCEQIQTTRLQHRSKCLFMAVCASHTRSPINNKREMLSIVRRDGKSD